MKFYRILIFISLFSILFTNCNGQVDIKSEDNVNLNAVYEENLLDSTLATGWYFVSRMKIGFERQLNETDEYYFIEPKPIATRENISVLEIFTTDFKGEYEDYTGIKIMLNAQGTKNWSDATKESIGYNLAFIIDDKLVSAPRVNGQITNGLTIFAGDGYTKEKLEILKKKLKK